MQDTMTAAARDVLAERERQISKEGWTPEHDDEHSNGELASAGACYAIFGSLERFTAGTILLAAWPWWNGVRGTISNMAWWKPTSRRRNLVKAGALILAEIERLDRAEAKQR